MPVDKSAANILITGVRAPAALELCRILKGAGHTVYAADSLFHPVSKSSSAITSYYKVPRPRQQTRKYGEAIAQIVEKHNIELIIPTCEEIFYLSYLSKHFDLSLFAPDFDILRKLHHKQQIQSLAADCGIDIPETNRVTKSMPGKGWIFKPVYSRFGSLVKREPEFFDPTNQPNNDWLAQKYISGLEYASYSIAHQGQLRAHVTYQSLVSINSGASLVFKAVDLPPIQAFVAKFIEKHRLTGQLGFDWIVEKESGKIYLLECNPRATSGVHFFGEALANSFLNRNPPVNDIDLNQPARKLGLPLTLLGWQCMRDSSPREIWQHSRAAKDVVADQIDWRPGCFQFVSLAEMLLRIIQFRCSATEVTTIDLEWNGEPMMEADKK